MADIKPFKIAVPDSALSLLHAKLESATFLNEVAFSDSWDYGVPLSDIKRLASRWKDGFDWRAQEARMNEMPQYTTKITVDGFDELNIHFVHARSKREDSIPLLFSHGCESSCHHHPRQTKRECKSKANRHRARQLSRSREDPPAAH